MSPESDAVPVSLQVSLCAALRWEPSAVLAGAEADRAALRVLATVASLGERPPGINEETSGLELEVARLQQKTHLLVELLAQVLARDATRPLTTMLSLSAQDCRWPAEGAVGEGGEGVLNVWLHPAAPEPLRWPAVLSSAGDAAGEFHHARLLPLGEAAQMALERYVFQQHRRAVAEARASRQPA